MFGATTAHSTCRAKTIGVVRIRGAQLELIDEFAGDLPLANTLGIVAL